MNILLNLWEVYLVYLLEKVDLEVLQCVVLLIVCLYRKICWSYTAETDNDLFMCSAFSWLFYCYAENMDTVILYMVRSSLCFII